MSHTNQRRVLHVIHGMDMGGAERIVVSLALGLRERSYTVSVCSFKDGPMAGHLRSANLPFFNLQKRSGFDPFVVVKLVRLLKRERIQILHTHSFSANFWGRVAGLIARVPVLVTTEHTLASARTGVQRVLDRGLSPFTTRIVAVCNAVRDSLVRYEGIPLEKIQTIYNGIERPTPQPPAGLQQELGLEPCHRVVVIVGRIAEPKGHLYLLEAVAAVRAEFPQLRVLMVGDGPMRAEVEARAERLGIREHIILAGRRVDIANVLAVSHIAVLPSVREGLSLTLLEYMAASLPVVASNVGGNSEAVVDGVSGLIVPSRDPERLAQALRTLLADPELARNLGAAARRRFDELFAVERMVEDTQSLYAELR
jgi:glycosyltransferase involved in cell wall biosynthesis